MVGIKKEEARNSGEDRGEGKGLDSGLGEFRETDIEKKKTM